MKQEVHLFRFSLFAFRFSLFAFRFSLFTFLLFLLEVEKNYIRS